jgi:hypothetical protein
MNDDVEGIEADDVDDEDEAMEEDVQKGTPVQSPTVLANHTLQRAPTNSNQQAPSVYVLQANVLQPKVVLKKELQLPLVKGKPKALLMAIQHEGVIQQ